ncbi:MAG: YkgJ family cysteine cluster protein [Nanoarchaeota archaeon]
MLQNFRCSRCGSCCLISPFLSTDDIKRIIKLGYCKDYFLESVNGRNFLKQVDSKCIFLQKNKISSCKIYDSRPKTCKDYPTEVRPNGDCRPEVLSFDNIKFCSYAKHKNKQKGK